MSDMRQALHRPVRVERISFDEAHGGQPSIRDTGVLVADVSFDLGPERLTDEEVLERRPELELGDLDAVRIYSAAPTEFEELLHRVFGPDPAHDDVLTAYLFLPRIVLSRHEHEHLGVPMKVRSSFEAAFGDAASARGMWLAAIGDLVFLDQIGTALTRSDYDDIEHEWPISSPERALERFSDLAERERAALYALRNALAHDFSLVNKSKSRDTERRDQLQHAFVLHHETQRPLIEFPSEPWDGNPLDINETHVHLGLLAELTAGVEAHIHACYDQGTLRLLLSAEETRRRYIFTHEAPSEEWEDQRRADEEGRWGKR